MIPNTIAFDTAGGLSLGFVAIIILIALIILAFEIWMFVDALRNTRIDDGRRVLWIIGMLLVHPFVAVIYYFTDRKAVK